MQVITEAATPLQAVTTQRVLVVDGGRAFGEGLVVLLEQQGIPALHADYDEAGTVARTLEPTVLLLDSNAADDVLTAVADNVRHHGQDLRIFLLSDEPDRCASVLAAEVGALDTISLDTPVNELVECVRYGRTPTARAVRVACAPSFSERDECSLVKHLTRRELDVLRHLVTGRHGTDIAVALGISRHTVRTHVQNILGKLGAHNRLEAAALGLRAGVRPVAAAGL